MTRPSQGRTLNQPLRTMTLELRSPCREGDPLPFWRREQTREHELGTS